MNYKIVFKINYKLLYMRGPSNLAYQTAYRFFSAISKGAPDYSIPDPCLIIEYHKH